MKGVIRQEEQIKDKSRIEKLMRMKNPTLLDINKDIVVRILENSLARLRLRSTVITNPDTASETLIRVHGAIKGKNLYRFWLFRQTFDKQELQSKYKYSPENMNNMERLIAKAGVSMLSSKVTLPTLKIEL